MNKMTQISGPSAKLDNTGIEFDPVMEGTVLRYEYPIANEGGSVLSIYRIETGCGCTTVEYSREIQPSTTGRIAVKIDTTGYGGSIFMESITVYTNDPLKDKIILDLSGKIKKFADISPQRLLLKGSVGDDLGAHVVVTFEPEYFFRIKKINSINLEDSIQVFSESQDNGYVVTVKSRQKKPGNYAGKIVLTTDHQEKPELEIPVVLSLSP